MLVLVFLLNRDVPFLMPNEFSRPKTESGRLEWQGNGWTFGEEKHQGYRGMFNEMWKIFAVNFLTPSFFLVGMLTHLVQEVVVGGGCLYILFMPVLILYLYVICC